MRSNSVSRFARFARLARLALTSMATACASSPGATLPPEGSALPPHAASAMPAARPASSPAEPETAPGASGASAPPTSPAEAPAIKVLGTFDDVLVAAYPPTGFDRLTPTERALAYHLTQAALAGDGIFTLQTSRYARPVTQAITRLLAGKDKVDPALRDKLVAYRYRLFLNHGIHDVKTGQKLLPPFSREELGKAARALRIAVPTEVQDAMFDPKIAPTLTNKTPGPFQDPITASAANHYDGVTSRDLAGFNETYELNGRIVKKDGKLVEEVYRAGGDGAPPGVAAKELGRVVKHLEDAMPLALPEERAALGLLVRYFKTGEPAAFREHDIAWLKQVFPVDYILGFIETYTDVRSRKGSFEAIVAIPDPARNPPLFALAKSAAYFEQKLPYDAKWKRETFSVPAAAAVTVLAATGDGGPFTFGGVNLPNAQDLRQQHGSKNFVTLSVLDTREALRGGKIIGEFAPAEARAELYRCSRSLLFATIGPRPAAGHRDAPSARLADPGREREGGRRKGGDHAVDRSVPRGAGEGRRGVSPPAGAAAGWASKGARVSAAPSGCPGLCGGARAR
jgi:dipeptidyl-peptidase III